MKPLGKYPCGVRVSFDAIGVNGVRERVVESRPYWTLGGVFVLVLLSLFTIACACGLCGEIAAVVAADEDRRHHDNAWVVEFKDGEGRVLARTKPLGVRILSWREELATAVKADESYGAFHLTRLGFLLLLLVPALLFVFATNPIEFQTPAELDDFQPPSEKTFDTTCWKKKSSVRASRSGRKA